MLKQIGWSLAALIFVAGCGAKQTGQRVGETLTDFASGVGKGIDKRMEVSVELAEHVSKLGLRKTVSKSLGIDMDNAKDDKPIHKGITVYFIASQPVNVRLIAKAINADGEEIGRSAVDIEMAADDAKYVDFPFDNTMDTQLVEKYVIDAKELVANDTPPAKAATDSGSETPPCP